MAHLGGNRDDRRRRRRAWLIEAFGVSAAAFLALLGFAHLLSVNRSWLLFFDGDSVILPLVERSLHSGQPFEWAMSTTVFLVEIPVYLVLAAATANPFAALTLNGLLTLLALYALLRAVTGVWLPGRSRPFRVAVALLTFAVPLAGMLLETTTNADSFELFSLLATTTYYYPTVLAIFGSALLLAGLLGGRRDRTRLLVGLGILTLISVTSNPLFGVWSAAPAVLTLLALAGLGRIEWRGALIPAAVLIAGCFGGVLVRQPLAPYLSMDPANYLHLGDLATPLSFYGNAIADMLTRPAGVLELLVISALSTVAIWAGVRAIRRTDSPPPVQFLAVLAGVTVLAVAIGSVLVGTNATRYLQPLVFAPLLVVPALATRGVDAAAAAARRVIARGAGLQHRSGRPSSPRAATSAASTTSTASAASTARTAGTASTAGATVAATAVVLLLVASGAVSSAVFARASAAHLPEASCLENWLGDRTLTGAGQFWAVRGLKAYGNDAVNIVQIDEYLQARAWMSNLSDYDGGTISYLIINDRSAWGEELVDTLGAPIENVSCGTYTILNYSGTAGEKVLTERIGETGAALRSQRGFE